mmetsp:Transcript_8478/g.21146  ORF Transcript_8478/g.21146 Transcript_8478/m.21146 type:complete len:273 (+) Transcript_8478:585-1403(+)
MMRRPSHRGCSTVTATPQARGELPVVACGGVGLLPQRPLVVGVAVGALCYLDLKELPCPRNHRGASPLLSGVDAHDLLAARALRDECAQLHATARRARVLDRVQRPRRHRRPRHIPARTQRTHRRQRAVKHLPLGCRGEGHFCGCVLPEAHNEHLPEGLLGGDHGVQGSGRTHGDGAAREELDALRGGVGRGALDAVPKLPLLVVPTRPQVPPVLDEGGVRLPRRARDDLLLPQISDPPRCVARLPEGEAQPQLPVRVAAPSISPSEVRHDD